MRLKSSLLVGLLAVGLLLANCSSMQSNLGPQDHLQASTPLVNSQHKKLGLKLLEEANNSHSTKSNGLYLSAADHLVQGGEPIEAMGAIRRINVKHQFNAEDASLKQLIIAEIALSQQKPKEALMAAQGIEMNSIDGQKAYRLLSLRAAANLQTNSKADALAALVQRERFTPSKVQIESTNGFIWKTINEMSIYELEYARSRELGVIYKGWVELGFIIRGQTSTPGQFSDQIALWQSKYPNHPGNGFIKSENTTKEEYSAIKGGKVSKIAVFLPLQGKHKELAEALRDGVVGAYQQQARSGHAASIQIYDTTQYPDIANLYKQVVSGGANFVIGPLTKAEVGRLAGLSNSELKAPIVAFNHAPKEQERRILHSNIYQFALTPENEARLVAKRMFKSGYKNALVIAANSPWGMRNVSAFTQEWQSMGGKVVQTGMIKTIGDQASPIKTLLQAQDKGGVRRQDMDVIVMFAPPVQARQLKPMLNFYHAGNVPTFASSGIYGGHTNPLKDSDLNGVIFCDMPLLIGNMASDELLNKMQTKEWSTQTEQYGRLYGLGFDAYSMAMNFERIQSYPMMGYKGSTGTLYIDKNHVIERDLPFAKMVNGTPVIVE